MLPALPPLAAPPRLLRRLGGALLAVVLVACLAYLARDAVLSERPLRLAAVAGCPEVVAREQLVDKACPAPPACPAPSPPPACPAPFSPPACPAPSPPPACPAPPSPPACPAPSQPPACPAPPSPPAPCAACPSATTAPSQQACPTPPPPPPPPPGAAAAAVGLAAGTAAPFAQGDDARYLILQSPDYGRYSNNRMTFSEAAGLAAFAGRTLLAPQFRQCEGGKGPSQLYNLGALAAGSARWPGVRVVEDAGLDLRSLCGGSVLYVWYNSITRDLVRNPGYVASLEWRGVTWPVKQAIDLPLDMAAVPPGVREFAREGDAAIEALAGVEPYASHFPAHFIRRDLKSFLTDNYFPYRVAALTQRCVVVQTLYLNLNWAVVPGTYQRVATNTWPAPTLDTHVAAWFRREGVAQHAAVGAHLRVTDLATGLDFGFAHNCEADPAFVVAALRALVGSTPGAADVPLLVASDNFGSRCASGVLAAFPRHVKVASGSLQGCEESAFIQEVLGRTAGFVGNSLSSFSVAIHWLRTARYGRPANSSVFPEGP